MYIGNSRNCFVAFSAFLLVSPLFAGKQEAEKKATPSNAMMMKKEASADDKAMMDKVMKAGAPGPEHERLTAMVGKWTVNAKHWKDPGKAPMKSTGTVEFRSLFDGRFVESIHKGDMNGMPFEGRGLQGYDNLQKKYVSTWFDNWSTQIIYMTGTYDPATKTFTSSGSYMDPKDQKSKIMKITSKMIDNNNSLEEFWEQKPDGRLVKMMEMRYTRQMM